MSSGVSSGQPKIAFTKSVPPIRSVSRAARLATLTTLTLGCTANSYAVLTIDGIPDSSYQALSNQYAGQALWVRSANSTAVGAFGSAVRLNQWYGITAAHVVEDSSGNLRTGLFIGNGSNVSSDPGSTRNIASILVYPTYNSHQGGTDFYTPDFAIIKFDQPLDGTDLTIGSAPYGSNVTTVGYGRYGTYYTGQQTGESQRRAFNAPAQYDGNNYYVDPSIVDEFDYYDVANYVAYLNGQAQPGDSGGPGFNAAGQLVCITDQGTSGAQFSGVTLSTRLDLYADWIAANTQVPEPATLALLLTATAGRMLRRRRRAARVP